jgi:hypothetical protein
VVKGTNTKQNQAWSCYQLYLLSIGLQYDLFLNNFNWGHKHRILSAFAQSIRESRFCPKPKKLNLSVRATLDCMAQTYKLADQPDPRLDADGKLAFLLQCQLQGYSSLDTPVKPQVAITASILCQFYKMSISRTIKALCKLLKVPSFLP